MTAICILASGLVFSILDWRDVFEMVMFVRLFLRNPFS